MNMTKLNFDIKLLNTHIARPAHFRDMQGFVSLATYILYAREGCSSL